MNKLAISVIIMPEGRWRVANWIRSQCAKLEHQRTWSLPFLIDQTQSPRKVCSFMRSEPFPQAKITPSLV